MITKRIIIQGTLASMLVLGVAAVGIQGLYHGQSNSGQDVRHDTGMTAGSDGSSITNDASIAFRMRDDSSSTSDARAQNNPSADTLTFRNVDLEQALSGAIAGDSHGMAALQSFLDVALGDAAALQRRTKQLLDALANSPVRGDFVAMADATAHISQAVSTALATAYHLPYTLAGDHRLPATLQGWDFGPESRNAPAKLVKISPSSQHVTGQTLQAFETGKDIPLFDDGLTGVQNFSAPVEDGIYRVYLLSTSEGEASGHPLGVGVQTNGQSVRVVDATNVTGSARIQFTGTGLLTLIPENDEPSRTAISHDTVDQSVNTQGNPLDGIVLATRALVEDGAFTLAFDIPEGSETRVVGMIMELSDLAPLERDLNQKIATLLSGSAPMGGPDEEGDEGGNDNSFSGHNLNHNFKMAMTPGYQSSFGGRSGRGSGGGFGGSYSGGGLSGGGSGSGGGGANDQPLSPGSSGSGGDSGSSGGSGPEGGSGNGSSGGSDNGSSSGNNTPGQNENRPANDTPPQDNNNPPQGDNNPPGQNPPPQQDLPPQEASLEALAGDDIFGFTGDSYLVSGCGSLFESQSLCDMAGSTLDAFSITWKWDEIELASDTLEFNMATGEGTLFDSLTSYIITLEIVYLNGLTTLTSSDSLTLNLNERTEIPVPGSLLLFLITLGGSGWLMRRFRK